MSILQRVFKREGEPRQLSKTVRGYRVTLAHTDYLVVASLQLPDGRGAAMGMDMAMGWPTRAKIEEATRRARELVVT